MGLRPGTEIIVGRAGSAYATVLRGLVLTRLDKLTAE
jgi:hypothetical protein